MSKAQTEHGKRLRAMQKVRASCRMHEAQQMKRKQAGLKTTVRKLNPHTQETWMYLKDWLEQTTFQFVVLRYPNSFPSIEERAHYNKIEQTYGCRVKAANERATHGPSRVGKHWPFQRLSPEFVDFVQNSAGKELAKTVREWLDLEAHLPPGAEPLTQEEFCACIGIECPDAFKF